MTTNPLDAIQARTDAATKGPWEVDRNYPFSSELVGIFATDAKSYVLKATDDLDDYPVTNGDAAFIAAAREDVPKLVAALRAVESTHRPSPTTESVLDWDCIEGDCEHDGDCPEKTITPCSHCSLPSLDGAEILIPYPCPTITAIREALG